MELWDFTPEQLYRGFEKFKKSSSSFISLNIYRKHCQPEPAELGITGIEQAYELCMNKHWRNLHPAFHCVVSRQLPSLKDMGEFQARQRFKEIYQDIVKRVSSGEQFGFSEVKAIELDPVRKGALTEKDRATGKAKLQQIRRELGC